MTKHLGQGLPDPGPGDHAAGFYAGEDEHRALLLPFLLDGLERGQVAAVWTDDPDRVASMLREQGTDADGLSSEGRLILVRASRGAKAPDAFRELGARLRPARRRIRDAGTALRIAFEMRAALGRRAAPAVLDRLAARVHALLAGQPSIALCLFDRRRFDASFLLSVLDRHGRIATASGFADNPFQRSGCGRPAGPRWASTELSRRVRKLEDRLLAASRQARLERLLQARSEIGRALAAADEEHLGLQEACRALVRTGACRGAWVGFAEQDAGKSVRVIAQAGMDEGYLRNLRVTWADDERGRGPTGRAIRSGRPEVTRSVSADPLFAPWRREAVKHGYLSSAAIPLKEGERTSGTINLYAAEPDAFGSEEILLLEDIAGDVASGLAALRARAARRAAEEALKRKILELTSFINNIPDMAWLKDRDSNFIAANKAFGAAVGMDPEYLVHHTCEVCFGKEVAGKFKEDDRRVMESGRQTTIQETIRDARGRTVFLETVKSPIFNEKGEVVGTAGIARDVTERRRTEEALREAEARYHDLYENAPDMQASVDAATGRVLQCNEILARATGYAKEEIVGRPILDLYHPDSREAAQAAIRSFAETGEVRNAELQVMRKDGGRIDVILNASAVRGEGGKILYSRSTLRDVTGLKQAEEQLRQAQKVESIGRLAGGVAHDFNNLLTAISGYAQLLQGRFAPDDPSRGPLDEILKASERAAVLTRQLLAFGRKQVLQPRVLDLNAVVSGMEKMLHRMIGEDVELVTRLDPALGRVKADPGQLEQVLMNLAVNARDAMPQGGRLVLETRNMDLDEGYARRRTVVQPGPYVELAVTDTGTGMSEEIKSHLFEPFFTTKEPGKGTGLGLSTVYGIVKQSGGYIWAYSEPRMGTTFKIHLPRVDAPAEAGPPPAPVQAPGGAETILLAEDADVVRSLAREVLRGKGYTVIDAADGRGAIELAGKHPGPIHLLLTDIVMPGMSGRELAAFLAAARPGIRVLYMSGYAEEAVVRQGKLDASSLFLPKPFTPGGLARKVREALDKPA